VPQLFQTKLTKFKRKAQPKEPQGDLRPQPKQQDTTCAAGKEVVPTLRFCLYLCRARARRSWWEGSISDPSIPSCAEAWLVAPVALPGAEPSVLPPLEVPLPVPVNMPAAWCMYEARAGHLAAHELRVWGARGFESVDGGGTWWECRFILHEV